MSIAVLNPVTVNGGVVWVDKNELYPQKGDTYYRQWYPITGGIKTEIITYNGDSTLQSIFFFKVVAQSPNLSLPNIPYVEIEEDVEHIKKIARELFSKLKIEIFFGKDPKDIQSDIDERVWAFVKGYKAASAKRMYTEEDMEAAVCFGMTLERFKTDPHKLSDTEEFRGFIQSLQPKVVSIEVEMEKNQCDGCIAGLPIVNGIHKDHQVFGIACTKNRYNKPVTYTRDGKTFLKVKKINYE